MQNEDEISFAKGDVIEVVPFDEPDESVRRAAMLDALTAAGRGLAEGHR